MKKVVLKSITLLNFKGTRNLTVKFNEKETFIHGKNESGKTTLVDAFYWLMYGKNSEDKTVFNIKTLDENNNPIHNLNHEVTAVLMNGSDEIELKRVFSEKWTKKRGSEISELTGNTTDYFVNEVPKTQSEFKTIVDGILSEDLQKILCNPLYFSQKMKWEDRRFLLSRISGEVHDELILSNIDNVDYVNELQKLLASNKTLSDYAKEYSAKRKTVKEQLDSIPTRIDEASRQIVSDINFDEIQKEIEKHEVRVLEIDKLIEDNSKSYDGQFKQISETKKLKFEKEQRLQELVNLRNSSSNNIGSDIKSKISQKEHESKTINDYISFIKTNIENSQKNSENLLSQINALLKTNEDLREKVTQIKNKQFIFDDSNCNCPTCEKPYDLDKIEEMKKKASSTFEEEKNREVGAITQNGISNNNMIENYKRNNSATVQQIESYKQDLELKEKNLSDVNSEILNLKNSLKEALDNHSAPVETDEEKAIKKEIEAIIIPELTLPDFSQLKDEKKLQNEIIEGLKNKLRVKENNANIQNRIDELLKQQLIMAQEVANFEKGELAIELYNKTKVEIIENRVNSMFTNVKFKMFEKQMNGGYSDVCEAMINGVPFNDLNTASKLNAGLEIINVLSNHYQVSAPILIDNRESVSNIIFTNSQVINLVVDPSCDVLTVK